MIIGKAISEMKSKTVRIASWQDIFITILAGWIGKRILDFMWEKSKAKLKFEGKTRIRNRIFVMFGVDILMIMFDWLLYIPRKEDVSEYRDSLKRFLRLHERYHRLAGNQLCCVCLNVGLFQLHFKNYVSEPNLYPPFNF
jgi:hypothetical protein